MRVDLSAWALLVSRRLPAILMPAILEALGEAGVSLAGSSSSVLG